MLWLLFAFLAALFDSLKEVSSKRGLRYVDEYAVSWSLRFFAALFSLPLLLFIKIPPIGERFWEVLIIGGGLNVVATIIYMKAYKHSDLSLTSPITAFTPLFLLVTSPFMLGEFPKPLGLIGVILIVLGTYILNIRERHRGHFEPFKALFREKGPKLMLAVAFIWSITSNYDKIGVRSTSPIFWVIAVNWFIALALLPIMLYNSKGGLKQIHKNLKVLAPIGIFSTLTLVFQMTAISTALVVYVTSIKRTGSIISVIFGWRIFKEKGIKERLAGVIIMVLGAVFIAFSG